MTIERKTCVPQIKRVGAGQATVVIATLQVQDKDGDVILPGFFGRQYAQSVGTHDWHSVPIGKGLIYEEMNEAHADLTFNLKTTGGRDWHEAILFDFEHPPALQQYSFGYRVREGASRRGEYNGSQVRFLGSLPDGSPGAEVIEISPVMVAAGLNTRTLAVKSAKDDLKQEGFEIQTLIFPKAKWDSAAACRTWLRDHDFSAGDLDETDSSYRFRQREPGAFARLRTICLDPSREAAGEECRVSAVGGPLKESTSATDTGQRKSPTLDQLIHDLDDQVNRVGFVQQLRAQRGKMLNTETIAKIDLLSQKFDQLRAALKLAATIERDPIAEELEARAQRVKAAIVVQDQARKATVNTQVGELYGKTQARQKRLQHSQTPAS